MTTTVALDDGLLADARELGGLSEPSTLLNEALKAYIEREAARGLATRGGTMPDLECVPRRRPE